MNLAEQLKYRAYNHQYKEDDILLLKNIKELRQIDKILIADVNISTFINAQWYLTQEKIKFLSGERLKVLSSVSWHMGIHFMP